MTKRILILIFFIKISPFALSCEDGLPFHQPNYIPEFGEPHSFLIRIINSFCGNEFELTYFDIENTKWDTISSILALKKHDSEKININLTTDVIRNKKFEVVDSMDMVTNLFDPESDSLIVHRDWVGDSLIVGNKPFNSRAYEQDDTRRYFWKTGDNGFGFKEQYYSVNFDAWHVTSSKYFGYGREYQVMHFHFDESNKIISATGIDRDRLADSIHFFYNKQENIDSIIFMDLNTPEKTTAKQYYTFKNNFLREILEIHLDDYGHDSIRTTFQYSNDFITELQTSYYQEGSVDFVEKITKKKMNGYTQNTHQYWSNGKWYDEFRTEFSIFHSGSNLNFSINDNLGRENTIFLPGVNQNGRGIDILGRNPSK